MRANRDNPRVRHPARCGPVVASSLALAFLLAPAGCGGDKQKPKPQPSPGAPFTATLEAPTHAPRATADWRYVVRARDESGGPIGGVVKIQFLFAGAVVGRGGTHRFRGTWRETINWPRHSIGYALTFRVKVITASGTKNLDYPVRVRPRPAR